MAEPQSSELVASTRARQPEGKRLMRSAKTEGLSERAAMRRRVGMSSRDRLRHEVLVLEGVGAACFVEFASSMIGGGVECEDR